MGKNISYILLRTVRLITKMCTEETSVPSEHFKTRVGLYVDVDKLQVVVVTYHRHLIRLYNIFTFLRYAEASTADVCPLMQLRGPKVLIVT